METENIEATHEFGKIATALAKAQGEIKNASKDAANEAFKREGKASKYATLAAIWDACRPALSKHEIAVVQVPRITENGMIIHTMLMHSSGERLTGDFPIAVPATATPQQIGSAVTYARKYSLASMVGVAPDDDDDGNAATETAGGPTQNKAKPPAVPAKKDEGSFWKQERLMVPVNPKFPLKADNSYSDEALEHWEKTFMQGISAAPNRASLAQYQADNQPIIDLFPSAKTQAICDACRARAEELKS